LQTETKPLEFNKCLLQAVSIQNETYACGLIKAVFHHSAFKNGGLLQRDAEHNVEGTDTH